MFTKSAIIWIIVVNLLNTQKSCKGHGTLKEFRTYLKSLETIAVFTGAGISVDSGIPTFRGTWGAWRGQSPRDFDTLEAFHTKNLTPLVWEYMNYKRYLVSQAQPNQAHHAIVELQNYLIQERRGRTLEVLTYTQDGLHTMAGSYNVCEVLGNVWQTICTRCDHVETNTNIPIIPAFNNSWNSETCNIKYEDLPRCKLCNGLLKPNVIFPDENVNITISRWLSKFLIYKAELVIFVGVNLANAYLAQLVGVLMGRAAIMAEFNTFKSSQCERFKFYFPGRCVDTLPVALDLWNQTY